MTLILAAISNGVIATASDCRFTNAKGDIVEDDASKTMKLTTKDAHLVVAFAGRADIEDSDYNAGLSPSVMNWLADYAGKGKVSNKNTEDFLQGLTAKLEIIFQKYYPYAVRGIVLIFAGRKRSDGKPLAFTLSNFDYSIDEKINNEHASNKFTLIEERVSRKPKIMLTEGMLSATHSQEYLQARREAIDLLSRKNSQSYAAIIRDKLLEMIDAASKDPKASGTVGDRMVGALLNKDGKLIVKHVPDEGVRAIPGYQDEHMVITEIKVGGDFPDGEGYQVGGIHKG